MADSPTVTTSYTVSGTALGCSSSTVASIVLKTVPSPVFSSNSPVCNGSALTLNCSTASFYTWSGVNSFISNSQNNTIPNANPSHSGAYQVTVTAVNGCTATAGGTVTVHPTPTVSAQGATVCSTQALNLTSSSIAGASYYWQGPNSFMSHLQNPGINTPGVGASGNYTVKVTSSHGCTNAAVAAATITAMPLISSTSDGPKCFGETLSLFGNSNNAAAAYSWSGPNGFNSNLQNPLINAVSVAAGGVYNLQVSVGPCITSTSTSQVVINPLPTATITSNSPVCETSQLSFKVTSDQNIVSHLWRVPPFGLPMAGPINYRDSARLSYTGHYTITLTDINNCKSTHTASLTIMANPSITAKGDTVCYKSGVKLQAQGGDTYKWYNATGVFGSSQEVSIASVSYTSATVYTVIGQGSNGCTSRATATVMTRPLPTPGITSNPKAICLNGELTLKGYGAAYYNWEGPGGSLFSGQEVNFKVSNLAYGGTYTLLAYDAKGCKGTSTTQVTVYNVPGGALTSDRKMGCVPFTASFNYQSVANSAALKSQSWRLDKQFVSESNSFKALISSVGDHILEGDLVDTNGCYNKSSLTIKAYPVPQADFSYLPQRPVATVDEVVFTNTSKGDEQTRWDWYYQQPGGQEMHTRQEHLRQVFDAQGLYPVVLVASNSWGCSDTIVKTIRIESDFNVFVPTAFTPNGDGYNEVFIPVATGIKKYQFMVFDRWGKKVFETSDIAQGWNGSFNGQDCPGDVYTWRIAVSSLDGQSKDLTGSVTLFR